MKSNVLAKAVYIQRIIEMEMKLTKKKSKKMLGLNDLLIFNRNA